MKFSSLVKSFRALGFVILTLAPAVLAGEVLGGLARGTLPFITIFPAVVLAGAFGGTVAGVLTAVLGLVAVDFLWFEPRYAFFPVQSIDLLNALFYLIAVGFILWATRSLRAERDRAGSYFHIAGTILVLVGRDGSINEINRKGLSILGYDRREDLLGKDWFQICYTDEDRSSAWAAFKEIVTSRRSGSRETIAWTFVVSTNAMGEAVSVLASGEDVTDQREAYAALARSEAQLRAVLLQLPAAVAIIENPDGAVVVRSDRSSEILGHPSYNARSVGDLAAYGGIDQNGVPVPPTAYPIARALLSGEVVTAELMRYRRPDNRVVDLEIYATPVRGSSDEILGAVGMAFDVSNRVRAEAELRASEARFRMLAEAVPGLLFAADAQGINTYINQKLRDFVGSEDPIPTLRPFIHLSDRRRMTTAWRSSLRNGAAYDIEFRLRRQDGEYRWVLCRAVPVRNATGAIEQWLGVAVDIEQQKRVEIALRLSGNRLKIALEAGELGTWEADLAGNKVMWDARLAVMLGLPERPVEMQPRALTRYIHRADLRRFTTEFETATTEGDRWTCEFRGKTKTGQIRWFVTSGSVLRADRRIIGVVRDVTDRRQREDELRNAVEARGMLIREADHRIKNSLQMVTSLLTIQHRQLTDANAAAAILDAVARVNAISEVHLALQKSGDLQHVDFGAMLQELCSSLAILRNDTPIQCVLAGDLEIDADKAIPLALVVSELLTNALRHAYPIGADGKITVTAINGDTELNVTVEDQGSGLPAPENRSEGLGSKLVRSLIQQLGATIAISSEPGAGTKISITLPRDA
jgi:PAS domain S-box-containing protein